MKLSQAAKKIVFLVCVMFTYLAGSAAYAYPVYVGAYVAPGIYISNHPYYGGYYHGGYYPGWHGGYYPGWHGGYYPGWHGGYYHGGYGYHGGYHYSYHYHYHYHYHN